MERRPTTIKDAAFKVGRALILAATLTTPACITDHAAENNGLGQSAQAQENGRITDWQLQLEERRKQIEEIKASEQRVKEFCKHLRQPNPDGTLPNIIPYKGCIKENMSNPNIK